MHVDFTKQEKHHRRKIKEQLMIPRLTRYEEIERENIRIACSLSMTKSNMRKLMVSTDPRSKGSKASKSKVTRPTIYDAFATFKHRFET